MGLCKNTGRATFIRISNQNLEMTKGKPQSNSIEADMLITIQDNPVNALTHIDRCMADKNKRK
eukprot:NODE_3631_length_422_cov_54.501340_g3197_i0.p4 GENE.NODE_3631_length_422_cov_54.501340_g3197_i0~~NODE_3631_length_422_cov_54.501340_g3197_i0.p4  ORF type:complete len:71 (+),score=39.12 NODE_3631_length_422_cov_54.501340_g3197_i0:27-215(+)